MSGLVCQSVDKIDDVTEWVRTRYWYVLEELEKKMLERQQSASNVVQLNIRKANLVCGGRRSTMLEIDPKEHEDRLYGRWIKRDKHNPGRGLTVETIWKRRAGGGRRGRATLRTMVAESTLDT